MFWGSVKCRFTDTRESLGQSRLKLWGGRAGGRWGGGGGGGEEWEGAKGIAFSS